MDYAIKCYKKNKFKLLFTFIIIILSCLLIAWHNKNTRFTQINLLLSANWTNMGTTVLIINESMVLEEGNDIELGKVIWEEIFFEQHFFSKEENLKMVENFIDDINLFYSQGIKAVKYKKTDEMLMLVYENRNKIILKYQLT